jgi:hypothetical protein
MELRASARGRGPVAARYRGDAFKLAVPIARLRRTIAPDAGLPAPRGGCGFDIALVGDALGQLRPTLAEEPLRHVGVADPAHGFRRARRSDEATAIDCPSSNPRMAMNAPGRTPNGRLLARRCGCGGPAPCRRGRGCISALPPASTRARLKKTASRSNKSAGTRKTAWYGSPCATGHRHRGAPPPAPQRRPAPSLTPPTSASAARFPFAMAQARRIAPPNDSKLLFAPSTEEDCIRRGQPP